MTFNIRKLKLQITSKERELRTASPNTWNRVRLELKALKGCSVTFNQWCAGKPLAAHERIRFEDIWNALVSRGCEPKEAGKLLSDLVDAVLRPDWE